LKIGLVDTTICSSCKVHNGFNQAWLQRQAAVAAAVNSARAANPSYGLVITGHSLGAAVATIAGAYFRSSGLNCDIYSYGSPRVGNGNFANYVSSTSQGSNYRITHLNDPVPHVPTGGLLAWLTNYYHTSPEYWLSNGSPDTNNYAITDIKLCKGINNLGCAGTMPASNYDIFSHIHYLNSITACNPSFTFRE
jgi:predicted lipase